MTEYLFSQFVFQFKSCLISDRRYCFRSECCTDDCQGLGNTEKSFSHFIFKSKIQPVSRWSECSTGDLVKYLTKTWGRSIHQFCESQTVVHDIFKAFECVWHNTLLSKIDSFGICLLLVDRPRTLLANHSNRTFFMDIYVISIITNNVFNFH